MPGRYNQGADNRCFQKFPGFLIKSFVDVMHDIQSFSQNLSDDIDSSENVLAHNSCSDHFYQRL